MDTVKGTDRDIIRDLAERAADVAAEPVMAERRELWRVHNSLGAARPMVLVFPEGSWRELLPDSALQCEGEPARHYERGLRVRLYYREHFDDDTVIEGDWVVGKAIGNSGWGIEAKQISSTEARGAWAFDPVIHTAADLQKIKAPVVTHDEKRTEQRLEQARDLLGDVLDVKVKGVSHISFHMMNLYTRWRGLAEVMMDMYAEPEMLHDAMSIIADGYAGMVRQYVEQNLLSLNNDGTYHSTGGNGYTDELPADGFDPGRVRTCDMWASAEVQEMAQVGPEQHREFCIEYEKRLLAPFGLNGYGCCEDLTRKLDHVKEMPNMRRISVAPFADVAACAPQLRGDYIFSWKPHPVHLVGKFDGERIRSYIRSALEATLSEGCVVEMVLKDTHTCENRPERFDEWTKIAKAECLRAAEAFC